MHAIYIYIYNIYIYIYIYILLDMDGETFCVGNNDISTTIGLTIYVSKKAKLGPKSALDHIACIHTVRDTHQRDLRGQRFEFRDSCVIGKAVESKSTLLSRTNGDMADAQTTH